MFDIRFFKNRGAILLEVVISIALFAAMAGVVYIAMNSSVKAVNNLRLQAQASDLAVTVLSEIQMGIPISFDSGPANFPDPMADWTWQVVTIQADATVIDPTNSSTKLVEVVVTNTKTNFTYHLAQAFSDASLGLSSSDLGGSE